MKYSFNYNNEKIIIESREAFNQWYKSGIIGESTIFYDEEHKREITVGELAVILSENSTDKNSLQENYQNKVSFDKKKIINKRPIIKYSLFGISILIGIILAMLKRSFEADLKIGTTNSAIYFGYAIGGAILYLLELFIISTIICKFSKGKIKINIYMIVNGILLVYLFYGFITTSVNLNNDKQFESAAREKILSIANKALRGEHIEKEQFDSITYGRYSEVLKISEEYYLKLQDSKEKMNESRKQVDLNKILDGSVYINKQRMLEILQDINEVIKSYDMFEDNRVTATDKYIHNAESLNLPYAYKRSFIDGVKHSRDTTGKEISEFNNAQKSILYCVGDILELMQSIDGQYSVENGKLLFSKEEDLIKYNKLVETLTNAIKNSNEFSEKINTQATDIKSELE